MAAQYYKINYKSDFVLTINSDAGWAVPFCIKFWTGMPSQAYFAGFDGEDYVNCRVGDTPTQLLVMFDDHHMPIGELKMQIAYHTTIEEFPDRKFDEVTNPTNVTVDIDGTEYQVMLDFTGETGAEIDFSMPSSGVMSVNGKIGYVTLNAEDVGAQPTIEDLATIRSGAAAGATAVQPDEMTAALATKQNVIEDLATIRSGAADGATAVQPDEMTAALATKQDVIEDLATIRSGAAAGATAVQPAALQEGLAGKQDTISDLSTIRSGAAAGATAVQPAALTPIQTALQTIEAVIPSAASSQNQLADKNFVNSSIATNTANFVGTYNSLAELQAVQNPTNNDYGFVIETDAQGNEYYDRYKYVASSQQWLFEYKVESTPFTAAQWAAIQSGITSALVTKLNALPTNAELQQTLDGKADAADIPTALSQLSQDSTHRVVTDAEKSTWNGKQNAISDLATIRSGAAAGATAVQPAAMNTALAAKQDTLTFDNTPTANSDNPVKSGGIKTALDAKQTTISTVNVTVDNNTGTPSGTASVSGSTLSLSFQNLKGATGATGATGPQGPQGERGLPGESGVTGDVSGFTVIQTIDPSATYGATDIAGAATVQATNQELTELEGELNGEKAVAYYTSAYLSGVNYVENPLINGKEYKLTVHQTVNSWNRFGFAKDNSGTDMYYIHAKNVIGDYEYTFNAPDPAVYPYMVITKPNTDSTMEVSYTTTGLIGTIGDLQNNVNTNTGNISTLTNNVSDLLAQTSEIDIELNGIDEQVYYTSAYLSGLNYVENELVNGREYKLFIHQTQATWIRFGFAKDDSGTDTFYIHNNNVIGDYEYTFNAPDPTVYPYMVLQKPNANSTFEIRYIVEGFVDSVEVLQEDVDGLKGNTFVKTINEQEIHLLPDSYKTGYIPCPMFRGVTYLVSLKLIRHASTPQVVAHRYSSNSEVGRIVFSSSDFASGNYVEFTPTEDVGYLLINFNSTYREPSGASMVLNVGYGEKTSVSAIDIKPLNGRKFIMLGDSITQLPQTGGLKGGVGIVEWFSHFSGAEVIRGAVGGRRLTRTGTKVTTAADITGYNIAVSFFDVIGLAEALASGDFSLQRAAYQWLVDNNYSPDATMIDEVDVLDALDMSTVDAITIFAGTNDWHNNVDLQTIKDAIDSIVETLLTAYPKLTIYFFTPIVRYESNNPSNWSDTWQNNAGLTIPQYVDAIMEQAKVNCIPVCDLYHGMGWTRYNVTQYITDGTHPHNGFGELAAKMFGFVNSNWPKVYRTIQAD